MKMPIGSLTLLLLLANCTQEPAELPYGPQREFMLNEVQPLAETYWFSVGSVSELVDGKPVFRNLQPQTAEEWAEIAAVAVKMGEFGEVLASPAYAEGRGEDWLAFAQGLQDVSRLAEQTAIDRDPEAVIEVGMTMYNVCAACHQAYPPAGVTEEVGLGNPSQGDIG